MGRMGSDIWEKWGRVREKNHLGANLVVELCEYAADARVQSLSSVGIAGVGWEARVEEALLADAHARVHSRRRTLLADPSDREARLRAEERDVGRERAHLLSGEKVGADGVALVGELGDGGGCERSRTRAAKQRARHAAQPEEHGAGWTEHVTKCS